MDHGLFASLLPPSLYTPLVEAIVEFLDNELASDEAFAYDLIQFLRH